MNVPDLSKPGDVIDPADIELPTTQPIDITQIPKQPQTRKHGIAENNDADPSW